MIMWGKIPPGFPRVPGHLRTTFQRLYPCFRISGVVDDVTGSRVIPEIDMAAAQTGSNTILPHRTARNKIPTPTSYGSSGRHIYFCYGDNVVEPDDIVL